MSEFPRFPSARRGRGDSDDWHYEVIPLTFGRSRLIWTDGLNVQEFW